MFVCTCRYSMCVIISCGAFLKPQTVVSLAARSALQAEGV